ncbi:unnamed protein product [Paramecium sonneborni]|uniref:Uncharacterized protein n=1 Tax=Paramecium sonneborni TaxID=65129 RepID=A0A8S1RD40_9CILI|nr:unnamed protein product [Paramecium sonneborni]
MLILKQKESLAILLIYSLEGARKIILDMVNRIIFGGDYNERSQKVGKQIEPDLNNEENYITFTGEYKADIKVGTWNTFVRLDLTGGGYYNEKGQKHEMWIENQKNYQGIYKNGMRIEDWKIFNDDNKVMQLLRLFDYWWRRKIF